MRHYKLLNERKTSFYIFSKIGAIAFLIDVFWFKYAYFESSVILYGSGALAIVSMIIDLFIIGDIDSSVYPLGITINIIMCVYSFFTGIFVAVNQTQLFISLRTYFIYSLFCLVLCYICYREKSIDWLMKTLVFVSLLSCIYTMFRGYHFIGYGYILSRTINPNNYGLILVVGICAVVYLSKESIESTILSCVILAILIWSIIQCGSRKSLIAAVLLVSLWIINHVRELLRSKWHLEVIIGILLVIFVAVSAFYVFNNIYIGSDSQIRMQSLGNRNEGSMTMRKYYYKLAWELFLEKPIFGVGFNQFQEYSSSGLFSHSLYAESISCWGLVGCLIYYPSLLAAIFRAWKIGFGKNKDNGGKKIFAILVVELFLGTGQVLYYEINHMILLTAVFCWLTYYQRPEMKEENDREVLVHECKYIR